MGANNDIPFGPWPDWYDKGPHYVPGVDDGESAPDPSGSDKPEAADVARGGATGPDVAGVLACGLFFLLICVLAAYPAVAVACVALAAISWLSWKLARSIRRMCRKLRPGNSRRPGTEATAIDFSIDVPGRRVPNPMRTWRWSLRKLG
jgi:hypothetical protein